MNETIASFMAANGSHFAAAIAEAWVLADPANRERLEAAFSDLFRRYAEGCAQMQKVAA